METLLSQTIEKSNGSNGNTLAITEIPSAEKVSNEKLLFEVLTRVKNGDFTARMPIDDEVGRFRTICVTLNEIIDLNEGMTLEFTRAANIIGKQGKLTERLELPNSRGSWRSGVESFNMLISDLVHPT